MLDVADGFLFEEQGLEGRQEFMQICAEKWEGVGHAREGAYMLR